MNKFLVLFIFVLACYTGFSQEVRVLSFEEVLKIAEDQSLDAISARHRYRASYWEYVSYKAEYLPALGINTTPVNLNRSMVTVTSTEGQELFAYQNQMRSTASININQNIGFTGGSVFINSDFQRITLLGDSITATYMAAPISIGFSQPLFAYNRLKWERKIQPLKLQEAKRNYLASMENVNLKAVNLFFDLALAEINLRVTEMNYANNDTLFKIAKGRYNIGTIPKNELLQMELSFLNSDAAVNRAKLDLEAKKIALRSFLGYNDKVDFELKIPEEVPAFKILYEEALARAKENSPQVIQLERQMIEAEQNVAQMKAENRFNADLYASYGLTGSAPQVVDSYGSLKDQQTAVVGISIPIVDWGKRKGQYMMAQSNMEVVKTMVKQQLIDFEQDVYFQVMQFNMQAKQCEISQLADSIAIDRYNIALQRFYIGKIDVLNLNVALTEKDDAKRSYISALRNYWIYFYTLRKIALFDFEKGENLVEDYDSLIE